MSTNGRSDETGGPFGDIALGGIEDGSVDNGRDVVLLDEGSSEARHGESPKARDVEDLWRWQKIRKIALVHNFIIHAVLTFFGLVGFLVRVGLSRLTTFPGSQYGGILWANFCGCFIMGYLVRDRYVFNKIIGKGRFHDTKTEVYLYIGLSTGFCGSVTSFSTFILELFELSSHQLSTSGEFRNPGYGVMVWMSYTLVTLAVSASAFVAGRHMASQAAFQLSTALYYWIICICSLLGVAGWIIVLVLSIVIDSGRYWTLGLVFAPVGVFARYRCILMFNKLSKTFMVGTFISNVLSTALASIFVVIKNGKSSSTSSVPIAKSIISCQVLSGLIDGLCGNYSTVSTFIAEMFAFKLLRHSYIYAATSIACAYAVMVLILGSETWKNGLVQQTCQI